MAAAETSPIVALPIVGGPTWEQLIDTLDNPIAIFAILVDGERVTIACEYHAVERLSDGTLRVPGSFEGLGEGVALYEPQAPRGELTLTAL